MYLCKIPIIWIMDIIWITLLSVHLPLHAAFLSEIYAPHVESKCLGN